jgi:hypothetical protein
VWVHLIVARAGVVLFVNCKCHHIRVLNAGGVVTIFIVGVLGKLACLERYGRVQRVGRRPNNWASEM